MKGGDTVSAGATPTTYTYNAENDNFTYAAKTVAGDLAALAAKHHNQTGTYTGAVSGEKYHLKLITRERSPLVAKLRSLHQLVN